MSETIILECKQSNSKVTKNGDYETTLNRPITIEEGDEVLVKNCFIDTVASSSGNVIVPEDTTLTFSLGMYIVDTEVVTQRTYADKNTQHPDGQRYVLCKKSDTTGPAAADLEIVTLITLTAPKIIENVKVEYSYKDVENNEFSGTLIADIDIPGPNPVGRDSSNVYPVGIACKKDSFEVTNLADLSKQGIKVFGIDTDTTQTTSENYNIQTEIFLFKFKSS